MNLRQLELSKSLYPFKHWFATILLGPIFLIIIQSVSSLILSGDVIGFWVLLVIVGVIYSFPTFFVYYFLYMALARRVKVIYLKLILNAEAVIGLIFTFKLFRIELMPEFWVPYTLAVILSSLVIKVDGRNKISVDQPDSI